MQAPKQSRHPERSASQIYRITEGFMARSRRTPAIFIGRCFWELSGRKLQRTIKKSQTPSAPGFPLLSSHQCRLCGSSQREPHAVDRTRNSRQEIWGSRPVPACRGGICGAPVPVPQAQGYHYPPLSPPSLVIPIFDGAKPTCPGVPWWDLRFHRPLLEMFFDISSITGILAG